MDVNNYLVIFQKAVDKIDKKLFAQKKLEVAAGIYHDCVFLKVFKTSWATAGQDPLTAETRIFFSVWVEDSALQEQKVLYNIHALKLRKLKGYSIESKKFASAFRTDFKRFEHKWPNVHVAFGPLTLMQGTLKIDVKKLQDEILGLANNFLEIEHLIDKTLAKFKK